MDFLQRATVVWQRFVWIIDAEALVADRIDASSVVCCFDYRALRNKNEAAKNRLGRRFMELSLLSIV